MIFDIFRRNRAKNAATAQKELNFKLMQLNEKFHKLDLIEEELYKEIDFNQPIIDVAQNVIKREEQNMNLDYKTVIAMQSKISNCINTIYRDQKEIEKITRQRQSIRKQMQSLIENNQILEKSTDVQQELDKWQLGKQA